MPGQRDQAGGVLSFWFGETRPRQWFVKDAAFDGLVRDLFLGLTRQALDGELNAWGAEPPSALALVLLLDQFPRQIWCNTAMAFVGDPQALSLSQQACEQGWLKAEPARRSHSFLARLVLPRGPLVVVAAVPVLAIVLPLL